MPITSQETPKESAEQAKPRTDFGKEGQLQYKHERSNCFAKSVTHKIG